MAKNKSISLHFDIKLSLWSAIKLRIAGIEKVIEGNNESIYTCFVCDNVENCKYAYARYNINGLCLYNYEMGQR